MEEKCVMGNKKMKCRVICISVIVAGSLTESAYSLKTKPSR